MAVEIKIPEVGESVTEALVARWLKAEGQRVERDEPVVELETDKVNVEVPAPAAGVLVKQSIKEGQTAKVGSVLGMIDPAGAPTAAIREPRATGSSSASAQAPPPPRATGSSPASAQAPPPPRATGSSPASAQTPPPQPPPANDRVPAAAPRATGSSPASAQAPPPPRATGSSSASAQAPPSSRAIGSSPASAQAPPPPQPPQETTPVAAAPVPPAPSSAPSHDGDDEVVPMSPIRKRIAQRLVDAQQTAALLTTINEIDMSAVMALRKAHQEAFQQRHGVKLGLMSFFVKATVDALIQFPALNAEIRGQDIVYHHYHDVGIAVSTERGLTVPVLRNAGQLSFAEIERAIADFADRAQQNKLKLDELQGGTFTITNGGIFGSLLSTPIVNPPQSGVLGMHTIQQRPVARDGQVVIRPMMYVALTYDHRLIDGREAVQFLKRIAETVEQPLRLLVDI